MCGIAGQVHLDGKPVAPRHIQNMTDAIAHRGPDGQGHWVEGNVALGHRRLSIIDLSPAGHQPMSSSDHRYIFTYNGEIYNFRELRTELEAKGYWFRSKTDSEVVLNALAAWGVDAISRFNGMFAFGLWDRKEKTLLLARDRYGIKPIYYTQQGNLFAFASEQKSIYTLSDYKHAIDTVGLLEYFTFQNFFTDRTLSRDIKILPAGHYLTLDLKAAAPAIRIIQYWDFKFQDLGKAKDEKEYIEELDRLFQQAVNRQLISDVEIGSYLSGGMDSGSITAIAGQSLPYLKTFTCGFDLSSASGIELAFDERTKAEAMSARFRTEHYEMVLKAGDMERAIPDLTWHLEEPRVGQSYPNYYAAKLASRFVKVVLSGVGGDELFGGYPWRYYRTVKSESFEQYVDEYYGFWQRLMNKSEFVRLFAPIESDVNNVATRDIFRDVFKNHESRLEKPEDYVNHSLYFEAKTFLHGLLVVEDKLSMAHSLESRVPFLDNDLVNFAMACPVSLKLKNLHNVIRLNENEPGNKQQTYFQRANDGKQLLRDVMARHIPSDVVNATKQGFSAPDASWFKGDSINYVQRKLIDGQPKLGEVMDVGVMKELVQEHLDGKENRRLLIWSLLNVEQWLNSSSVKI